MVEPKSYVGKNGTFLFNMSGTSYQVDGVLTSVNETDESLIFDDAQLYVRVTSDYFLKRGKIEIDSRNLVAVVMKDNPEPQQCESKKETVRINLPGGSMPRPTVKLRRESI